MEKKKIGYLLKTMPGNDSGSQTSRRLRRTIESQKTYAASSRGPSDDEPEEVKPAHHHRRKLPHTEAKRHTAETRSLDPPVHVPHHPLRFEATMFVSATPAVNEGGFQFPGFIRYVPQHSIAIQLNWNEKPSVDPYIIDFNSGALSHLHCVISLNDGK
ncbi:hypothetical protein EK21DRAFT_109471 [Setomelanomma holmii]|uniref:Uncharacterized protein n=1 Tax=Setomelanomma holmii TaxID=210430 RepID=A0A9P4HH98_9PLEO|nr:hypothetical protein EK21DRAFT_109471 [Setomelanomma holmii]